MANKFQRYEAFVKLDTGHLVMYHNINTGLYKFHKFVCEKFSGDQKWLYYRVRRKENKEVLDTIYNQTEDTLIHCIKIKTKIIDLEDKKGVLILVPFLHQYCTIWRRIFISCKMILEKNSNFIKISKSFYEKIILQAKNRLYQDFLNQNIKIENLEELKLGNILIEEEFFTKKGKKSTFPHLNFP